MEDHRGYFAMSAAIVFLGSAVLILVGALNRGYEFFSAVGAVTGVASLLACAMIVTRGGAEAAKARVDRSIQQGIADDRREQGSSGT